MISKEKNTIPMKKKKILSQEYALIWRISKINFKLKTVTIINKKGFHLALKYTFVTRRLTHVKRMQIDKNLHRF